MSGSPFGPDIIQTSALVTLTHTKKNQSRYPALLSHSPAHGRAARLTSAVTGGRQLFVDRREELWEKCGRGLRVLSEDRVLARGSTRSVQKTR